MIKKIIKSATTKRHIWRKMTFSDMSEIYLAVFMRTMAVSLVGIFVPVYLLKNGFSFDSILIYFTIFCAAGTLYSLITAYLMAYFGSKRVMRLSFLLQIVFSFLLINLSALIWPVVLLALIGSAAAITYFLPYYVDFSKAKNPKYDGKEIGLAHTLERVAAIAGPFLGGFIATYFRAEYVFVIAAIVLVIAMIILMFSSEPKEACVKLRWSGLSIKSDLRTRLAFGAFGLENVISLYLWPTFLALVVFTGSSYVKIGSVTSPALLLAAICAVPLGKLLDKRKGRSMIAVATAINAFIHLTRSLVVNLPMALVISLIYEPVSVIYRMAIYKGFFDAADESSFKGQRISYIVSYEIGLNLIRTAFWVLLLIISLSGVTPFTVCVVGFGVASLSSLLIRIEQFPALR